MRAASKLEQAHPFSPHARRKTTSSPIVKPLLPLNVMPFPNINDPASTSALDVEDEYLNSAAKMADPSTMVSTFSPPQRATCLYNTGPTAAPAYASCKSRRVVPAQKRTRRRSARAGLIALPAPAPLARALPAPSSRVQQLRTRVCMLPVRACACCPCARVHAARARVCMLPVRARGGARGVALALAVLELAVQRHHEGHGPARKHASLRTRPPATARASAASTRLVASLRVITHRRQNGP
ncbi:hypothetical protein GGX14DRAFT_571210 [Mycena pura]|uniref:Uncharacterized protein n=1 Tax=Mycena pura TaxID=153505 RepID=A0AAD6Y693_9AGAR|nr:hypothetical protein GGX14DRAFT_571210 [Mycena pura]